MFTQSNTQLRDEDQYFSIIQTGENMPTDLGLVQNRHELQTLSYGKGVTILGHEYIMQIDFKNNNKSNHDSSLLFLTFIRTFSFN